MNLTVNKTLFTNISVEKLNFEIEKLRDVQFCEVWLEENGKSICLLKNSGEAFLMYLREEGDSAFSSLNLTGNPNEFVEFYLSNGQKDLYSKRQVISFEQGKTALFYFFETGEPDKSVDWKED